MKKADYAFAQHSTAQHSTAQHSTAQHSAAEVCIQAGFLCCANSSADIR